MITRADRWLALVLVLVVLAYVAWNLTARIGYCNVPVCEEFTIWIDLGWRWQAWLDETPRLWVERSGAF